MKTLVIGSKGQLGRDLLAQLGAAGTGVDLPELDVTDAAAVTAALQAAAPTAVINCAAVTNVDGCETAPEAAFAVNALGALHTARAAAAVGARLVHISTDYVFGRQGARPEPYTESAAPGPINVYGISKLAGEDLVRAYHPDSVIVRTSGLFGHAGALGKGGNFVETMLRLGAERDHLRVVADQRLSPTSTAALAPALLALAATEATGVFHLAAEDSCTWHEFTCAIMELAGYGTTVEAIPSSEYPTPARRPLMSALLSERLTQVDVRGCGPWRGMLAAYLETRPAPRPTNPAAE